MKNDPRFADNPLFQIRRLEHDCALETENYTFVLTRRDDQCGEFLYERASKKRKRAFGNRVKLRAMIDISNECGEKCGFCARSAGNGALERFRLTPEDTAERLRGAERAGINSFVLRAASDMPDAEIVGTVCAVRRAFPKSELICETCGARGREFFAELRSAGADACFIPFLAPSNGALSRLCTGGVSVTARVSALDEARRAGLRVGTGFFAGSPGANAREIAENIALAAEIKPDFLSVPPFCPERGSAMEKKTPAKLDLALFVTGLLRLTFPDAEIESAAALDLLRGDGRELGLLFGASCATLPVGESLPFELARLTERLKQAGFKIK